MDFQHLTDKNIFAIPVGEAFEKAPNDVFIVYAPLNGNMTLATRKMVEELELLVNGDIQSKDLLKLFQKLTIEGKFPVYRLPKSPHEMFQIDILSNYTCNFKCIYCYSAAGRSSQQAKFEDIKAVIDYLFKSGKKQINPYIINFSGGGEPLLSFPLIQQTISYIHEVTANSDYQYSLGVVTNGSLLTEDIALYFKENVVDVAVSFEILEDLQNKERGSYDKVSKNIDMLNKLEVPFGIRTTFTPESVTRMSEMVEELHSRYPYLRKVVYDTVLAPALFPTPLDLETYYDNFINGFYSAKALGAKYDILVQSIAVEMLQMVRDRTCQGKIVLTPLGSISSCARVSSPKESLYNEHIYGEIKEGKLLMDEQRFSDIMSECNIYSQKNCYNCYAKWNCGGGCRLFNQSFSEPFQQVRCNFVRKVVKKQALNILSERYSNATCGRDIFEDVRIKFHETD
jgi:radical SAM protein with 4Fe4S-binding SPASM domain